MELEEKWELGPEEYVKYKYECYCKECAMFDCSLEELKKNRVKIENLLIFLNYCL